VNIKRIASAARRCFFQKRYATVDQKTDGLQNLLNTVKTPLQQVIAACACLSAQQLKTLTWSEQQLRSQLLSHGHDYLESVTHYIKTGCATAGKRLSFHLDEIECFSKGKAGKLYEFGRAFQLGRLAGNFVIVSACTTVRMDDKKSFSAC